MSLRRRNCKKIRGSYYIVFSAFPVFILIMAVSLRRKAIKMTDKRRKWTEERRNELKRLRSDPNLSDQDIAERLGVARSTIYKKAKQYGYQRKNTTKSRVWTDSKLQFLHALRKNTDLSNAQIAEAMNIRRGTLDMVVQRYNLPKKPGFETWGRPKQTVSKQEIALKEVFLHFSFLYLLTK